MGEPLSVLIVRTYEQGGSVMPVLLAFTAVLWYALGWRLLTLRRGSNLPLRKLVREAQAGTLRPRGIVDEGAVRAVKLAGAHPGHVRRHLDEALQPVYAQINVYKTVVRTIVALAPLTGLLGTVGGMIETFDSLAEMQLYTQGGGVAGGISEALFSTQMGLAVAVPGLVLGRLLERRQQRLEDDLLGLADVLGAEEAA